MGVFTIFRVYEVPADSQQEATDRMIEAIVTHVERDFHVKDIIREPGAKPGEGKRIDLRPAGWLKLVKEQLGFYEKRISDWEKRLGSKK